MSTATKDRALPLVVEDALNRQEARLAAIEAAVLGCKERPGGLGGVVDLIGRSKDVFRRELEELDWEVNDRE